MTYAQGKYDDDDDAVVSETQIPKYFQMFHFLYNIGKFDVTLQLLYINS